MALSANIGDAAERQADNAIPLDPGKVRLSGWLGQRVEANLKNRLLKVDMEERLRPFRNPTENEGWSGEHIGKWLHAASLSWSYSHDPALKKRIEEALASLQASQAKDGYLGTYGPQHRWVGWDVWAHKYNLIGLISCYEITGDARALEVARKIGDLLVNTFGDGKRDIIKSGEHVGMAATSVLEPMVLLHRATGDSKFLEFAKYITRAYDQPNGPKIIATLTETHSVAKTANRKAYEMMSNLVGLCELYRETGDEKFLKPVLFAYDDIVENQMYLTGGTSLGEHFQDPHVLPNTGNVSENCAQVTWLQLCIQLLRITGEAKYADTIERIVYNHLLASQRPSGEALCYFTPLSGKKPYDAGMNCCTSSGPRGIALAATVAYTHGRDWLAVNFYESSTAEFEIAGVKVNVKQETQYPVDGRVAICVEPAQTAEFAILLRIPAWCRGARVQVNEDTRLANVAGGQYLRLARQWKPKDRIAIELPMPAVLIRGTHTNAGMVAVERGPLVLAADSRLNPTIQHLAVTPVAKENLVDLKVGRDPNGIAAQVFQTEGLTPAKEGDRTSLQRVPLVLTSFAEAGRTGSNYAVWLSSPERLERIETSPFLFGRESYSREGNVSGSIADGDSTTWRVTFDGRKRAEDWFAVETPVPRKINTIVFHHGQCYHDGGWWDVSKGKPRIQIQKGPQGAWIDVATVDSYPATTATESKGLASGQRFVVHFPPMEATGIRIIGAPACGDNPKQAFASCAELFGALER